jgi:hypothetical protein
MPRVKREASVLALKISLTDVEPSIWRRLLVPTDISLGRLHLIVNEAMGWTNSHLHSFTVGDRTFGDPELDPDGEVNFEDERKVKLSALLGEGRSIAYEYDFGYGWEHDILVEKRLDADARLSYPLCVGGARACPPEDCGGVSGYEALLAVLLDEDHHEHDDTLTWVGGHFDPASFDVNRTNRALWGLPWPRR